jgi:tRNA pseudouridine38-40 synthase
MKIALGIRYEGTCYHGWQAQKGLLQTVQTQLEKALSKVANHSIRVVCAGRTDAGVHAIEQVVHFETEAVRANYSWVMGANKYLPKDITIYWATPVSEDFHARFSAIGRYYRYIICRQSIRPTLLRNRVGWYYHQLSAENMHQASQYLLGEHDFQHFRSKDCQAKTSIRTIAHVNLIEKGPFLIVDIKANAFLHNMVRNIVGALVEIGSGRQTASWLKSLIDHPEKTQQSGLSTAPPQGLYLMKIFYPSIFQLPINNNCPNNDSDEAFTFLI